MRNDQEFHYLLLIFKKFHDIALDAISKYNVLQESSDLQKRKIKLMIEQTEILLQEKTTENASFISPLKIMNRVEDVKKSRYNFDKYLELINNKEDSISTMINKAFGNDQ